MLYLRKRKIALKKGMKLISLFFLSIAILQLKNIVFTFLPVKPSLQFASDVGLIIIVCIIAYKPLDHFLNFVFREFIFKEKVGFQSILINSIEDLNASLDLREFSNLLVNTFYDLFNVKHVAFLVKDEGLRKFVPRSLVGFNLNDSKKIKIDTNSKLVEELENSRFPILRDNTLKSMNWPEASQLNSDFELLRAQLIIPILDKGELKAFISVSSKPSHTPFFHNELRLFNDFAMKLNTSLQNAIKYEHIRSQYEELKEFQSHIMHSNKFSAMEQLATGIAHEIHNPLTIISGKAQMLLLNKGKNFLTQKSEEDLKGIVEQTTRAADITRKLLLFSRTSPEHEEQIPFETIIDDTFELISYQTSLEKINIQKEIDSDLPKFKGHLDEFREVFLNLILNAVQSVEQEGEITVILKHDAAEGILEIRVEDTGCGIEDQVISNVFDAFYTTKHNSLGLGLFVVQRIIQRNKGGISIESDPSRGTCVSIRLPMMIEVENEMVQDEADSRNDLESVVLDQGK